MDVKWTSEQKKVCLVYTSSTKTGINMDAVKLIGEMIKETAEVTKHLPVSGLSLIHI